MAKTWHVYAFEFADNHAYVGSSHQILGKREGNNLYNGPVSKYAKIAPNPVQRHLEDGIYSATGAKIAEQRWVDVYRTKGWVMLNKNKCGVPGQYTDEELLAAAKNYHTKAEWYHANYSEWNQAKHRSAELYRACTEHMVSGQVGGAWRRGKSKYTAASLMASARFFTSRCDWRRSKPGEYIAAWKLGKKVFVQCVGHMKRTRAKKPADA